MPEVQKNKIARIQVDILRLPTIRAHALSVATMKEQRSVILQIETNDGRIGLGEAATIGGLAYSDESPDSIKLTLEHYFAPLLIGRSIDDFGRLRQQIEAAAIGNFFAKMAVETALLDLVGQQVGMPVSELLGGRLSSELEIAWTLASGNTDTDIEEAKEVLDKRLHRHFKLKIGKRNWRDDVSHCAAICNAFKGHATVRVDVNQAWDLTTAKMAIPALQEAGVVLVEQPMAAQDYAGAKLLREQNNIAIMADEALRGGKGQALKILEGGAADVFALKIAQAGGLTACRAVADMAAAAGLGLYGGTMLEGPIATIASAHLFATMESFAWHTELFGPRLLTDSFVQEPLAYGDFSLQVPNEPGLGLTLNKDVFDDAVAREQTATKA